MRALFFVGLCLFLSLSASAQTITVSNFLNPDAPVARESLALITGQALTDEEAFDPFFPPTTLGGVTVKLDGVLQRIQLVSATRAVILVQASGKAVRTLELKTKFNVTHIASVPVATVWPGISVQDQVEESERFYAAGTYTNDPTGIVRTAISSAPIPVGSSAFPTRVFLQCASLRVGGSTKEVMVRLNGIPCLVVSVSASPLFVGLDEVIFQIPPYLANNGVMDLTISVIGRNSNLARINLGPALGLAGK